MKLMLLPNDIDLSNVCGNIVSSTDIYQIAVSITGDDYESYPIQDNRGVNAWLLHHMDEWPFHKLCYSSTITTEQINNYLNENGNDFALQIDEIRGMTPLHVLTMNPYAPTDAIFALCKANTNAANVKDDEGKTPLDYALNYNPCDFVRIYSYLCDHEDGMKNELQSFLVSHDDDYYSNNYGKTPLHVLVMNPSIPTNTITALLEHNMEAAFCLDNEGKTTLDYAKEYYNADGFISMIAIICNHRNSMALP